jgi:hypothetical protein
VEDVDSDQILARILHIKNSKSDIDMSINKIILYMNLELVFGFIIRLLFGISIIYSISFITTNGIPKNIGQGEKCIKFKEMYKLSCKSYNQQPLGLTKTITCEKYDNLYISIDGFWITTSEREETCSQASIETAKLSIINILK